MSVMSSIPMAIRALDRLIEAIQSGAPDVEIAKLREAYAYAERRACIQIDALVRLAGLNDDEQPIVLLGGDR